MDTKTVIEMLVDGGMEQSIAEQTVAKVISKFKAIGKPLDMDERTFAHLIKISADNKNRRTPGDVFYATVLGFSNEFDDNHFLKEEILSAYARDPQSSIAEGAIKIENGTPTPYDSREMLGKEGQFKNRNFGKVIETKMVRNIFIDYDGALKQMKYKSPLKQGVTYEISGKVNESKYAKGFGASADGNPTEQEIFEKIANLGANVKYAYSINDLPDVDDNEFVLVAGTVQDQFPTQYGAGMVISDDESIDSLTGYSKTNEALEQVMNTLPGYEVILFGRIKQKDKGPVMDIFNVFVNPTSRDYGSIYNDIASVLNE